MTRTREIPTLMATDRVTRLGRARFGVTQDMDGRHYSAAIPLPLGFGLFVGHYPGDHFSLFFRSYNWAMSDFHDMASRLDTREGRRWIRVNPKRVKPLAAKWDATGRGHYLYTFKAVR